MNNIFPNNNEQNSIRCLTNGKFDPIYCFSDKCLCINSFNAAVMSPVYNRKIIPDRNILCCTSDRYFRLENEIKKENLFNFS